MMRANVMRLGKFNDQPLGVRAPFSVLPPLVIVRSIEFVRRQLAQLMI